MKSAQPWPNRKPEKKGKKVVGIPFKKGVSGNPAGRPKGSTSALFNGPEREAFKAAVVHLLSNPLKQAIESFGKEPTGAQAIAVALVTKSATGDNRILPAMVERIMGKAPQPIEGNLGLTVKDLILDESGVPE